MNNKRFFLNKLAIIHKTLSLFITEGYFKINKINKKKNRIIISISIHYFWKFETERFNSKKL